MNPLAIALAGLGFSALSVGLQGFTEDSPAASSEFPDFAVRRRRAALPIDEDEELLLLFM